jgi:hypothetical protein
VDTIRQEAERPLNEKFTGFQHYQEAELDQLQELKDDYKDLLAKHKDLKALCKVRAWTLRAKERECTNWAVKAHTLSRRHHYCKIKGPRGPSG